ncbi:MAG TPA: histidine--tRNA ligase [Polyangiaceae bacterium]|jgi:histidyl-tRNA synthetase|nr:histidine--tRNA ligase [Polyangiaceae bacterium]
MQYRAAKGMNDILPDELRRWRTLEEAFRRTVELAGYAELRTPLLEATELFVRSVGESTDIVQKEMFTLQHHGDSLTLRPEGTASAARAYVEHTVFAREPVTRWYYLGPMFRAERPQRGRYRQFYQAGAEIFGDPGPACDAEMIDMLYRLFVGLGITDVEVVVNSLGSAGVRERYRDVLREHLEPNKGELSETSQRRLGDNPLRILDSKAPRDQELVREAPPILDFLDDADRAHWDALRAGLDALGVPYRAEPRLVRGLDYYTRTLFEFQSSQGGLGSQNALGGGGRYDGMVADLGGPAAPAIGFALGLERILLAMNPGEDPKPSPCFIAPIGERATLEALVLARSLRERGVPTDLDGRGTSMKSMLRRANSRGARLAVLIGDQELDRGVFKVKDLAAHTEIDVPRATAAEQISELMARAPLEPAH